MKKKFYNKYLIIVLFLCIITPELFSTIKIDTVTPVVNLRNQISKILGLKNFKNVNCSVKIISAQNKDILYSYNEAQLLPPASTMKIITTLTAFSKLNSKFLFKTTISADRNIKNGVIEGNIYIKGFGNPFFSDFDLSEMVKAFKEKGITKISGDVIGDDSYFDNQYLRSDWIDKNEDNEEQSTISALSINRNYLEVIIKGGSRKSKSPEISIYPSIPNIKIINSAKNAKLGRRNRGSLTLSLSTNNNDFILKVTGLTKMNETTYRSVQLNQPALFAAALLKQFLIKNGVAVIGKARIGKLVGVKTEISKHEISLDSIITLTNKHSDNYLADYLLKILGAELKGTPGHAYYGKQIIADFLKENGISESKFIVFDGSGLSRKNKLSAEVLTQMLYQITKKKNIFERFYKTLPIAGVDGTMKGRLKNTNAEGNARAKTGTLNGVSSLCGYIYSADNELLIFSMIMSDFRRGIYRYRNYQDEILTLLSEFSRKKSL